MGNFPYSFAMPFAVLMVLAGLLALGACAHKSSSRIYEGDGPTIRYSRGEAGGSLGN
ncbi:MAG: hypothetical protein M3463_18625 [Verrucomicrobiota bacterium]|nr:hypothetical protein [Verrucomicrobiota bacterium]